MLRKNYQVLAFDYDGTLAYKGHMSSEVARVIHDIKQFGFKCILVTGRILDDLLTVCPHVNLFDVLVVENGAVVCRSFRSTCKCIG